MEEKDSFAAALQKAREIAAKMQVNTKPETVETQPVEQRKQIVPIGGASGRSLALQIANNLSKKAPRNIRILSEGVNKDGDTVVHMMIPAMLVCLFAGRENETVQWLRKSHMVKVEMNLEHPSATTSEKPLTIIGKADQVEACRESVNRFIREKDELLGINANNMQLVGTDYSELPIPKEAVGLVIGKQGENIKKVNNETGCVVKFRPLTPYDDDRFRICTFHGSSSQVKRAREQISDLTEYIKQKYGLARPIPKLGQELIEVKVSTAKAGIVIGRGGETIKQINSLSGAIVCIDRSVPDGSEFRIFFVCGTPQQIEHAKYLIKEKSGEEPELLGEDPMDQQPPPNFPSLIPITVPPNPFDQGYQAYQYQYGNQGNVDPSQYPQQSTDENAAAWAAYYQQYYAYQQQQNQQATSAENSATNPENPSSTTQTDYTAAWQAYYQQLYTQYPEYYQQLMAAQQNSQPLNTVDPNAANQTVEVQPQEPLQPNYHQNIEKIAPYEEQVKNSDSENFTEDQKPVVHDWGHGSEAQITSNQQEEPVEPITKDWNHGESISTDFQDSQDLDRSEKYSDHEERRPKKNYTGKKRGRKPKK